MMVVRCLPFNNVAANQTATLDLNNLLGYTVERIILILGGTFTKAQMTSIRLLANGKVIWDTTGTRTDTRMQYRGIGAVATALTLDFSEIRSKTQLGQNIGAIDTTVGIQNLRLEIAIGAATGPTLIAFAEVAPPQTRPEDQPTRALIARIHEATFTVGAAGQFALPVPHFNVAEGGSLFKRINFFSANMTGLLIRKNGVTVHETTKAFNDFNQPEYRRVAQASLYVADFILADNQSEILSTRDAQTVECLGTFSAGETIGICSEVLEPLAAY